MSDIESYRVKADSYYALSMKPRECDDIKRNDIRHYDRLDPRFFTICVEKSNLRMRWLCGEHFIIHITRKVDFPAG